MLYLRKSINVIFRNVLDLVMFAYSLSEFSDFACYQGRQTNILSVIVKARSFYSWDFLSKIKMHSKIFALAISIIVVLLTNGFIASPILNELSQGHKASAQTSSSLSPATTTTKDTNSTGYSQYNGNSFSLQYPTSWKVKRSDMSMPGGEAISIVNSQFPEFIQVFLLPTEIAAAKNATQAEIDSHLEQIFPRFVRGILSGVKNGTLIELQRPVYDKYIVDGHKVGSAIFIHSYPIGLLKTIAVGTIVGKNDFALTYSAPEQLFNQNLPIVDNIIKSVNFLK
jgi:hypothetical protein